MKTTQVISKYLNRRIEKLKERGESTNVPKHFLELVELSDIETKRLDTDEYDIALNFTPERYSRYSNSTLGKFVGKPSYIIRRKEDNHVISGYIKDMGLDVPVNSFSRDSSDRYMDYSEYENIDSEGLFALMQKDVRLKAFLDGVAIDDYTAEDLSPTGINTITAFDNIRSPSVNGQAFVLDESDFKDVPSRQYSHVIEFNAKANSPSDTHSISIPMQAAKNSASWYQIHNLVEPEDFDSFRNELTEAVENDIDAVAVDLYYEFIKHGLPESITEDDLKGRKYTQSELNFIRAKKDDPSPDSPLYRHQYIDRMRSYFDVTHKEHFSLSTVNCLKNAGFRVADSQWGVDWSLHTFLMRDHNQMLQPITPEKVQAISNGRIPSNEFVQGMGVKGTNRKTFDKFMKIIGANVIYNRSTKELLSLSALPKELLDPEDFVKHRKDRDHSFSDMWRTISPYLINHASKLTEAQDEYQNNPSPEGKVKIKELSAKYKWLSQGGDKLKNFNSLQEKLKGGTLRDYGTILNQYLQAVTQRVAKELSTDPDEIFSIDLEEGNTEVVSLDVSALWEQHLSNTEEELKEHHLKNYAYTLLSDFIAENNLSSELVFEGLESDVAKEEIDLTSYNSDSDRIISNLSKHYPDIDDLETEVYSMTEIVNDNEQYFDVREMFEEPSELDGTDLFKHIQSKASDYRHILELNEDAHVLQTQYQRDLSEFGRDGDFSWTPFFEGERDLGNGLKITAISSKNRLLDEATTQQHCVFSYLQKAMCGEAIILSVTKGDERVATVEISHDDFEDFEIEQCYGKNNEAVGVVIDNAVSEFVETLNEDPDALDIEIPDEITAQIDLDEAESTPSKYASRLSQIPFETDAAHKAYFILEEMTPDEFNVDSFFEYNSWGELLYSSEFYKEIQEIRAIANEFKEDNITPHDVIDIKHSQGTTFNPEAIREAIKSNIAPTMTFEDKLSQQLKEAAQEQTPNNPQQDIRQQQAMRL